MVRRWIVWGLVGGICLVALMGCLRPEGVGNEQGGTGNEQGGPGNEQGVVFHVSTAAELQAALDAAAVNGEDDTIYLAAGTYRGNFEYLPEDGRAVTIRGEEGTTAREVVLDGAGAGSVFTVDGMAGFPTGAALILEGVTLRNGAARSEGLGGGGLSIVLKDTDLRLVLRGVIIEDNLAEYRGGGISLRAHGDASLSVEIRDAVIRRNRSPGYEDGRQGRGGGIWVYSTGGNSSIELFMVNSLIYGNEANWTGGGIELAASEVGEDNVVRAVFVNTTIADNVSDMNDRGFGPGGGIYVYGYCGTGAQVTLELYNCIVWGNVSRGGEDGQDLYLDARDPGNAAVRAYHCDLGDVYVDDSLGTPVYETLSVIDLDPLFADPAAGDFSLQAGSPCVDAGTLAVPDPPGLPQLDLAGNPRACGHAPDLGAFECCP